MTHRRKCYNLMVQEQMPNSPLTQQPPPPETSSPSLPSHHPTNYKIPILILSILFVLSLFFSGYLYFQNMQLRALIETTTHPSSSPTIAPSQSPSPTPIETNHYPVKYILDQSQEVAQSFQVESTATISGIRVTPAYGVGSRINLSLYELVNSDNLRAGTLIANSFIDPDLIHDGQPYDIAFESETLYPDTDYVFILDADDNKSETMIKIAYADIDPSGKMFVYSRLIGGNGNILDSNHSWQPKNDQDIIYELIIE